MDLLLRRQRVRGDEAIVSRAMVIVVAKPISTDRLATSEKPTVRIPRIR